MGSHRAIAIQFQNHGGWMGEYCAKNKAPSPSTGEMRVNPSKIPSLAMIGPKFAIALVSLRPFAIGHAMTKSRVT